MKVKEAKALRNKGPDSVLKMAMMMVLNKTVKEQDTVEDNTEDS